MIISITKTLKMQLLFLLMIVRAYKYIKQYLQFCRSNERILELQPEGMSARYYGLILLRNPIKMLLNFIVVSFCFILPSSFIKNTLYRFIGIKVGKNVIIAMGVLMDPNHPELITIGDESILGVGTWLMTHELTMKRIRMGRIDIGKQVLIGARSTIRSGVIIGDRAAVGLQSLVLKDVHPKELVGGVPAKLIKKLEELV